MSVSEHTPREPLRKLAEEARVFIAAGRPRWDISKNAEYEWNAQVAILLPRLVVAFASVLDEVERLTRERDEAWATESGLEEELVTANLARHAAERQRDQLRAEGDAFVTALEQAVEALDLATDVLAETKTVKRALLMARLETAIHDLREMIAAAVSEEQS